MKNTNILFFLHASSLNNGATRSLVDMIMRLKENENIKVVVIYPDKKGTAIKYLEDNGITTYHVLYGRWDCLINQKLHKKIIFLTKSFIKQFIGLLNVRKILNIIKLEKINLMYTNTSVIYMGALLNKITKIPHIWHIREFGKEDHGLKNIYGDRCFEKCLNKYTTKIIYISKSIKEKFDSKIMDKNKSIVIYNDISPEYINPKETINKNEILKLVIIGTIQEGKGQLEVIKAVEKLKKDNINVVLHIAGTEKGEYYQQIKKYIGEHDLNDDIKFDGFVEDTNEYRKNFDVGIIASSNEAFGRVTIEGMLSALAMVGANSSGTRELIEDGKNGLLYELHNVNDLANKIKYLHKNRDILEKISYTGLQDAKSKYTVGNAAKSIYSIIQDIDK